MKRRTARALCAAGLSLSLLAGLVPAMAAGPAEVADSLYINGNIYTVDEDFSTATTMAVKGDRILYVGDQAGAEAYVGAGTEITDLGGKTVLPGLIEGHMHVSNLGENHLKLDCYFKSKEDILEMVRQAAKEAEPGEWIQGSGWLDTLWDEPGFPSKEELDAVAPNNPVYLLRADNHMGWFNSMALEMAGITKDTPEPQGGQILKTDKNRFLLVLGNTDTLVLHANRNGFLVLMDKNLYHFSIRSIFESIGEQVENNLFIFIDIHPQIKFGLFRFEQKVQCDAPRPLNRNSPLSCG